MTDGQGNDVLDQAGAPIKVAADGTVPPSSVGVFNVPTPSSRVKTSSPARRAGTAEGTVRSGVLEESGVDPAKVMVEMVGSLRTFQSDQQAIQAIDQTLQAASTQVGSLTGS